MANLYEIEAALHAQGRRYIAGLDEAGRGPLAGPVCAAAVIFEPGVRIIGVNDSKQLSPEQRDDLYDLIMDRALAVGVGLASAAEIDTINILQATKLACGRALRHLKVLPDYLLLDALHLETNTTPQQSLIKGDSRSFSIAAASIIAKVARDRLMFRYAAEYPDYGFHMHKGYGTPFHRTAISRHGRSTLHRFTFLETLICPETHVISITTNRLLEKIDGCRSAYELQEIAGELKAFASVLPQCECEHIRRTLSARGRIVSSETQNSIPFRASTP